MRLFAAIDVPEDQRLALQRLVGAIPQPQRAPLRFVAPQQWHITLAFYGEVEAGVVPALSERLRRAAARTPPLQLQLRGAGTFPPAASRARVLWVGVAGDLATLTRLAERCRAAGTRAGLTVPAERFRAHLTIARARRGAADATAVRGHLAEHVGAPWEAAALRLVRSTLGASVRHDLLAEHALAGTQ